MSHNIKTINNKERGIIKYIFYIFIIILILSFLGFNLREFMNSDGVTNNLGYVWEWILKLWENYLKPIYDYLAEAFGPWISDFLNNLVNNPSDIVNPPESENIIPK